jgi:hypothetical protein
MVKLTQKGGNAVINIVLWIFAIIGIVAIIYLVIVYITTSSSKSNSTTDSFPPNSFMTTSGLNCPDYWIKVADSNGKVHCRNAYGIPLKDKKCSNSAKFSTIKSSTWTGSEDKANLSGVKERCKWLNECGGVWQGVQQYC